MCSKCPEAYHTILSGVPFSKHLPRLADIKGLERFSKLSKFWKVYFTEFGSVYLRSKTPLRKKPSLCDDTKSRTHAPTSDGFGGHQLNHRGCMKYNLICGSHHHHHTTTAININNNNETSPTTNQQQQHSNNTATTLPLSLSHPHRT